MEWRRRAVHPAMRPLCLPTASLAPIAMPLRRILGIGLQQLDGVIVPALGLVRTGEVVAGAVGPLAFWLSIQRTALSHDSATSKLPAVITQQPQPVARR